MSWLSTPKSARHLDEVVAHVNEVLDLLERDGTEADAKRCLSDALTRIQTELGRALSPESQAELLSSDEVANQLLVVNLLLDRPDERLVIYGTLAPGKPNHDVIEDLSGGYRDCSVRGRISEVDGLPYFTWSPSDARMGAQLFSSRQLPDKWNDLDRFEGDGYKRRLIPVAVGDGLTVASIYMSTADDWWSSPGVPAP